VDTRDKVLEEEQYNTWVQYYKALDPGFCDNNPGFNTNKNNIPLCAWAQLDKEG
jgi:hypothetical protein